MFSSDAYRKVGVIVSALVRTNWRRMSSPSQRYRSPTATMAAHQVRCPGMFLSVHLRSAVELFAAGATRVHVADVLDHICGAGVTPAERMVLLNLDEINVLFPDTATATASTPQATYLRRELRGRPQLAAARQGVRRTRADCDQGTTREGRDRVIRMCLPRDSVATAPGRRGR